MKGEAVVAVAEPLQVPTGNLDDWRYQNVPRWGTENEESNEVAYVQNFVGGALRTAWLNETVEVSTAAAKLREKRRIAGAEQDPRADFESLLERFDKMDVAEIFSYMPVISNFDPKPIATRNCHDGIAKVAAWWWAIRYMRETLEDALDPPEIAVANSKQEGDVAMLVL